MHNKEIVGGVRMREINKVSFFFRVLKFGKRASLEISTVH